MGSKIRAVVASTLAPLAALGAGGTAPDDVPQGSRETFEESVVVRELEVWFDASVLPPLESLGRRDDTDFGVLQDGVLLERVPAPTRSLGRLPEVAIWFDEALARPAALARGARGLATAAPALASAGPVEVTVLGAERSLRRELATADALAAELLRLARRWSSRADRPANVLETRLTAVDRLALELAARDAAAPRAVFVVAEPWAVDASQLNDLAAIERGRPPADQRLVAIEQAGRLIAASGWVAYVVDAREPEPGRPFGRRPETGSGASEGGSWALFRFPIRERAPPGRAAVALDVATDLGLRPLAHLVRASSGTLVGEPGAVGRQLTRLRRRRRLVVRSPERGDRALSRLEVRWTGGDGRELPAPRWLRNGEPPELEAVRRRLPAASRVPSADGAPD